MCVCDCSTEFKGSKPVKLLLLSEVKQRARETHPRGYAAFAALQQQNKENSERWKAVSSVQLQQQAGQAAAWVAAACGCSRAWAAVHCTNIEQAGAQLLLHSLQEYKEKKAARLAELRAELARRGHSAASVESVMTRNPNLPRVEW